MIKCGNPLREKGKISNGNTGITAATNCLPYGAMRTGRFSFTCNQTPTFSNPFSIFYRGFCICMRSAEFSNDSNTNLHAFVLNNLLRTQAELKASSAAVQETARAITLAVRC